MFLNASMRNVLFVIIIIIVLALAFGTKSAIIAAALGLFFAIRNNTPSPHELSSYEYKIIDDGESPLYKLPSGDVVALPIDISTLGAPMYDVRNDVRTDFADEDAAFRDAHSKFGGAALTHAATDDPRHRGKQCGNESDYTSFANKSAPTHVRPHYADTQLVRDIALGTNLRNANDLIFVRNMYTQRQYKDSARNAASSRERVLAKIFGPELNESQNNGGWWDPIIGQKNK